MLLLKSPVKSARSVTNGSFQTHLSARPPKVSQGRRRLQHFPAVEMKPPWNLSTSIYKDSTWYVVVYKILKIYGSVFYQ